MDGGLTAKRKKKAASAAARGFMCGCGGAKSVSIVSRFPAAGSMPAATTPLTKSCTSTTTTATSAKTRMTVLGSVHEADGSAEGTPPNVDALLRQLRELERGVRALSVQEDRGGRAPRHGRSASDWGAAAAASGRRGRLEEESVAVVTESDDPLGDFRRSMVQMIVENEITGAADLRDLLQRFLSLNSARHHHLILRAFADVWEEFVAGVQQVHHHNHHHPRPRPVKPLPYSATTS
ncbi:hypothetical protein ABZP36_005952 [Zizania latifolia]